MAIRWRCGDGTDHAYFRLILQSTEKRSQLQNKQRAMVTLQEKLVDLKKEKEAKKGNAA